MPRVVLNMIVKDESAVIERCLRLVRPYIDAWVIVDTGSSDDTPALVEKSLSGIPGELHHRLWRSHGENRNEALQLAYAAQLGDYFLFIDADDTWEVGPSFEWPDPMDLDAYDVWIQQRGMVHRRLCIVSARKKWCYPGTAHSAIQCTDPHTQGPLAGITIRMHSDGARRASADPQQKYRNDARLFMDQLRDNPHNRRAMFYLAQSYRDYGELELAARWYRARAESGGWDEEVFCAKYEYAKILRRLERPREEVFQAFFEAYQSRPHRAEPLLALAELAESPAEAFVYAAAAKDLPFPENDRLFIEKTPYDWKALDRYALAAWAIGVKELAAEANEILLASGSLPHSEIGRVRRNLRFSRPPKIVHRCNDLDGVLDDLCITILTGRRLDLLKETIVSLPAPVLGRAHVQVYVNGHDPQSYDYLCGEPWVDDLEYNDVDAPEPIAHAVTRLLGKVWSSKRPLWMHLEDDWRCDAADGAFLLDAAKILKNPHVGQVRLRLAAERVMSKHMVTRNTSEWKDANSEGVAHRVSDLHYTFNPSLLRTEDAAKILDNSVEHEVDAARNFMLQGWRVAQIVPGAFAHIGAQNSLRKTMGR